MIVIIFFILGLLVGSFLNVLVYRLHTAEKLVFDRSKCPHCKKLIRWYDNIPVLSFVFLKLRCRECQKKISWQYPIVEILTAIVFSLVGWKFFNLADLATWVAASYYLVILSSLIAILVYDWLYMEIPGIVLWPAIFAAIIFNLWADWSIGDVGNSGLLESRTYAGVLAAMAAFAFFFLMSALSKEKWMGMGDAYLVILLGLILGWPEMLLAMFLAFAIGAIYGIVLIALHRKKLKSAVPFAPFLVLGSAIALFFYSPIIGWYWGLFI